MTGINKIADNEAPISSRDNSHPRGPDSDGPQPGVAAPPIARREAWTYFAYLATWSYLLYGLGNATPYLRSELNLSDFEAGLHGSALALGVLATGLGLDYVARRFGSRWMLDFSVLGLTIGVGAFALAPAVGFSLLGAMILGVSGATLGTMVNINLSRSDSLTSRRLLSQANAVSMVTAGAAPLAIGMAVQLLGVWRLAMLLPVIAAVMLSLLRKRPTEVDDRESARVPRGGLPRVFWLVWLMLVCIFAIEFSFVFWGSTMISRQTGIATADATLLASFFVAGMFVVRATLGAGFGTDRDPRLLLSIGMAVVILGAGLVWTSRVPVVSGFGLFLGGLGTAGLFPIGLAVALEKAGRAKYEAATRATLASGLAVLVAPSVLGLASDFVGVATAWLIIPGLAVAALAILWITPQGDTAAA